MLYIKERGESAGQEDIMNFEQMNLGEMGHTLTQRMTSVVEGLKDKFVALYNTRDFEYKIEKLNEINFVDINFAALVKHIVEDERKIPNSTTCWQERTSLQPKLLVQYL